MGTVFIKISKPRDAGSGAAMGPRARVFAQVRRALLRGEIVALPGIGRIAIQQSKPYVLTHPDGGKSRSMRAQRKVVFQPDRALLQILNEDEVS